MPPYFVQKEKTPRHTTVGHCANGTKAPCHTTTRLCTKWEPRRNGTAGDILRDVYGSHDAWETDRFSLSPFPAGLRTLPVLATFSMTRTFPRLHKTSLTV